MRAAATFITFSVGAVLWVASAPAQALGFGRIGNTTQLGQPLNFAAQLRLDADETLARECVAAEVFVGDNKLQSGQVRVTLEPAAEAGERTLRVTTNSIIDEPVVTVSVTVGCTSKVTRKFVAFIDPPLINPPQTAPADAAMMVPQRADSQVAPLVAIVEAASPPVAAPRRGSPRAARSERAERDNRAVRPAPRSRVPTDAAGETVASKPLAAKRPAPKSRGAPPPRAAASGPRLELEAAPAVVARAASAPVVVDLPLVAAPPLAASAPVLDEQAAQLARERERIAQLEQGLAQLRSDSLATQQALAALQARLKQAESERYANPLVYALAWVSALLALAVGALWWRQSRARGAAQWWAPPPVAAVPAPRVDRVAPPVVEPVVPTTMSGVAPAYEDADQRTAPEHDSPPTLPAATLRPSAAATESARELSVEELIDLEQQAEFFVVLGQDEAAIELLMSHVRNDAGVSPLPYLKLLEIYRRRGEADAYERIRDRFNRRFNAYAPDWNSDLQQGLSLDAYPETVERLQKLWVAPARAMDTLAASLFRRDSLAQTYDLPAYRELLFLYSIARDFAERGVTDLGRDVDLLLPMHDEQPMAPIDHLAPSDAGFQNSVLLTQPLDLDVSFAPPLEASDKPDTLPGALYRSDAEPPLQIGFVDFDLDPPKPGSGPR